MGRRSSALRDRRVAAQRKVQAVARGGEAGRRRGCLFCRRRDVPFTTVEHIFPESLGNTQIVLPVGVVCDVCNNGPLSVLDQVICEFGPIMFRRATLGIPNKRGVVPSARFDGLSITNDGNGNVNLLVEETRKRRVTKTDLADGQVRLNFSTRLGRRLTPRYASQISRAILKAALECAWTDHGEAVLGPQFDHIRAFVLGEPRDGWVGFVKAGDPEQTSTTLQYHLLPDLDGLQRMVVAADYYGVTLGTDSITAVPDEPQVDGSPIDVLYFKATDYPATARLGSPAGGG